MNIWVSCEASSKSKILHKSLNNNINNGCGRGVAGALLSVAEFVSGLGSAWGATFFGLGWLPDSGAALRVLRLCWFPAAPAIN